MAKSLERDPQVESILRNRTRELGLEIGMERSPRDLELMPEQTGRLPVVVIEIGPALPPERAPAEPPESAPE